jgi:hypothetical protein
MIWSDFMFFGAPIKFLADTTDVIASSIAILIIVAIAVAIIAASVFLGNFLEYRHHPILANVIRIPAALFDVFHYWFPRSGVVGTHHIWFRLSLLPSWYTWGYRHCDRFDPLALDPPFEAGFPPLKL